MHLARSPLLLIGSLALLLAGCTEQSFFLDKSEPEPGISPGRVQGRVCDPSGRTWLPDALAYTHIYSDAGTLLETRIAYTDRDGYWSLDDLPGEKEYTFYVQYGPDILAEDTIFLDDGEEVKLEEPECFDPLQLDVAVITGDYDDFALVLNYMGFANYELIDGLTLSEVRDFLLDSDAMSQYDMIFFNGGFTEEDVVYDLDESDPDTVAAINANITAYVDAGGTVYASDWAYDVVEQNWPDRVDWVGTDEVPDDAQQGDYDYVSAAVSDSALAGWLGTNFVDIEYDLAVWPPIESVAGSVSVHLAGDVHYRQGTTSYSLTAVPMLVSFSSGNGKVVFSTFRVAKNSTTDMLLVLQYMMYNL